MLLRSLVSAATLSLLATSAEAQALFTYQFGDPVERNSSLTVIASGPDQAVTETDTDVGQTPIDGSPSYGTSLDEGAVGGVSGAICTGSSVAWNSVLDSQSQLTTTPRARFIQFDLFSQGSQYSDRVSSGPCNLQVITSAIAAQSLSTPFTLTGPASVCTPYLQLDRSGDLLFTTGNPPGLTARSTLTWTLYEDTNGNGVVDAGEPIADGGLAQQSITASLGQTVNASGSYVGTLPAGMYVLTCTYAGRETVQGNFQGDPTLNSSWTLDLEAAGRFRLELL